MAASRLSFPRLAPARALLFATPEARRRTTCSAHPLHPRGPPLEPPHSGHDPLRPPAADLATADLSSSPTSPGHPTRRLSLFSSLSPSPPHPRPSPPPFSTDCRRRSLPDRHPISAGSALRPMSRPPCRLSSSHVCLPVSLPTLTRYPPSRRRAAPASLRSPLSLCIDGDGSPENPSTPSSSSPPSLLLRDSVVLQAPSTNLVVIATGQPKP